MLAKYQGSRPSFTHDIIVSKADTPNLSDNWDKTMIMFKRNQSPNEFLASEGIKYFHSLISKESKENL